MPTMIMTWCVWVSECVYVCVLTEIQCQRGPAVRVGVYVP